MTQTNTWRAGAVLLTLASIACASSAPSSEAAPSDISTSTDLQPVPPVLIARGVVPVPSSDVDAGPDSAPSNPPTALAPMPLISQNQPAFTNHGTAADAVDSSYATAWTTSHVPQANDADWLAVDLSGVPKVQRGKVYSVWFNEYGYNYDTSDASSYKLPGAFEIQANAASGGQAPSTGWVSLVKVSGNELSSGANIIDLTGYNWVRFYCTAGAQNAAAQNTDVALQWNLFDAHLGNDGWKFAGDSITANSMGHQAAGDSFDQLVHKKVVNDPAFEMGGHGGWSTSTLLDNIDAYLANFPGLYFAIPLGTNDAGNDPVAYAGRMTQLIDKVLLAKKIPVIPTIPYTGDPGHAAVPQYNQEIQKLYVKYGSKLVVGPDLYAVLYAGRSTMFDGQTDLHPNAAGNAGIRKAWAQTMLKNVYGQ